MKLPIFKFNKLKVLPQLGNRDLVCLTMSGNSLKLAHASISPTRREILNVARCDIQGLSDDDIARVIRTSFDNLKLKTPEVINIIPVHLTITKNIEIPSQDPQEIKEIIDLQGSKHTPYSREEIIIDHLDLGVYRRNYTKILLIIVTVNVIRRQIDILKKAGLDVEKVFFVPEPLTQVYAKTSAQEAPDVVRALLHVDSDYTDFIVVAKGKPIFTRSIPIGMQHFAVEKARYQQRFVEETKKSLESYANENIDKQPEQIIITGASDETLIAHDELSRQLGLNVTGFSFLENAPLSGGALKDAQSVKGVSFVDVIAPLIAHGHTEANLIPEEIRLRKIFEEKSKDLLMAGISIMIVFVLICCILMGNIYFKTSFLRRLKHKYEPINQEAKKLEDTYAKMQTIKYYLRYRGMPMVVLDELYGLIPMEIRLNNIRLEPDGRFTINGNSRTMATVFSFISDMEESAYFRNVETRRTTKRKEGEQELVDFEVVCIIEGVQL
jgi:Tfp pilus assembly PilM family ATPase/Tfp pilus assembly protein PilN